MNKQSKRESAEKFKLAHPNYFRDYSRQYFQENRERLLLYHREYYKSRKEYFAGYVKRWRIRNRDKYNAYHRQRRASLRIRILTHYGNGKMACIKCGESRLACLSIDHIKGGGTRHRRQLGSSHNFYSWLVSQGLPKGYQTLCMNCQWFKRVKNGETN